MIYLDNNATTKIDSLVLDAMMPYLTSEYGNSASNHPFGVTISQKVKEAREQISELVQCDPTEIIFTSGATESVNIAIKGICEELTNKGNHIITVSAEHPAVLDTCKALEASGHEVTYLAVDTDGLIDLKALKQAIKPTTILISVMYVNNETGVIQPIKAIADIAHEHQIAFMSDATQAVGKLPIAVYDLGVDILAFSGHKFYGPKGVGGLFVRNKRPFKVKLSALIHGGGHERGMRSGTLNVPGIVGLGKAAEIARNEMEKNAAKITRLRLKLELLLLEIEDAFINGGLTNRLYNVCNIRFKGVDADAIISGLTDIMISNGSACSSTKVEPSHVLKAMGLSDDESYSSIRISLSKFTTDTEVDTAVKVLRESVNRLRQMNLHTSNRP